MEGHFLALYYNLPHGKVPPLLNAFIAQQNVPIVQERGETHVFEGYDVRGKKKISIEVEIGIFVVE